MTTGRTGPSESRDLTRARCAVEHRTVIGISVAFLVRVDATIAASNSMTLTRIELARVRVAAECSSMNQSQALARCAVEDGTATGISITLLVRFNSAIAASFSAASGVECAVIIA